MSELNQNLLRPQLHFTPPSGWMNDPNGLLYHDGEYHLFYQYNPADIVWGPMHWGHAVSKDLCTWEHLPIALYPAEDGAIFSGSAVIDTHNTAGFGAGAMVAIYTLHIDREGAVTQNQGIAYSHDKGRTWTKYEGNPVIEMPADMGHHEFRDPKVDWYGTPEEGHWFMALSVKDEVWIYTSPDLKGWELTCQFGLTRGGHGGVWECPDLFEMPVEGDEPQPGETIWVLSVGVQDGSPAGGNGVQYFLGQFDGKIFTPLEAPEVTRWFDYGPDYYAAVTYNGTPDGRRILVGWMNNWPYSHHIPAETYRGMQSMPRTLHLVRSNGTLDIQQRPVAELDAYWDQTVTCGPFTVDQVMPLEQVEAAVGQYSVTFTVHEGTSAADFGIHLRAGGQHRTIIGYLREEGVFYVDRKEMGLAPPKMEKFTRFKAPVGLEEGRLTLHILVDHQSIEVWANDGEGYTTALNYPLKENIGFELFAVGGQVEVIKAICRKKL